MRLEQLTEVTRIDIYTPDDTSEADNEESYFLVLEHVRIMVLTSSVKSARSLQQPKCRARHCIDRQQAQLVLKL